MVEYSFFLSFPLKILTCFLTRSVKGIHERLCGRYWAGPELTGSNFSTGGLAEDAAAQSLLAKWVVTVFKKTNCPQNSIENKNISQTSAS